MGQKNTRNVHQWSTSLLSLRASTKKDPGSRPSSTARVFTTTSPTATEKTNANGHLGSDQERASTFRWIQRTPARFSLPLAYVDAVGKSLKVLSKVTQKLKILAGLESFFRYPTKDKTKNYSKCINIQTRKQTGLQK